jgi:hypothetical protein
LPQHTNKNAIGFTDGVAHDKPIITYLRGVFCPLHL